MNHYILSKSEKKSKKILNIYDTLYILVTTVCQRLFPQYKVHGRTNLNECLRDLCDINVSKLCDIAYRIIHVPSLVYN